MAVKDLIRDKILRTALKMVNRFGYGSLALSELARQTKISKQRLYYHFPTPEDLILDLAQQWSQSGQEHAIQALIKSEEIGAFKILDVSRGMFSWMKSDPELSKVGLVLYQSSPYITKLDKFMSEAREIARTRMKDFIAKDPRFAALKNKDIEQLITSVHSYMYGFYFYIIAMSDFDHLALHEKVCEEGLRKLLNSHLK